MENNYKSKVLLKKKKTDYEEDDSKFFVEDKRDFILLYYLYDDDVKVTVSKKGAVASPIKSDSPMNTSINNSQTPKKGQQDGSWKKGHAVEGYHYFDKNVYLNKWRYTNPETWNFFDPTDFSVGKEICI